MDLLKTVLVPIHKEGYFFIAIFAIVSIFMWNFSSTLGWLGAIITLWCVFFFRDPARVTPIGDNLVISPADGLVQKIEMAEPPAELKMGTDKRMRISIFLNVFNVHVNRVPATGKIKTLSYRPGKFINASLDKASVDNERQAVLMVTKDGHEIAFTQIAGLIARRILCNLEEEQEVKGGERFGLIRFGSRMDIYLPHGINPLVVEGQQAIAGETILADFKHNPSKPQQGEVR